MDPATNSVYLYYGEAAQSTVIFGRDDFSHQMSLQEIQHNRKPIVGLNHF